MIQTQLAIQWLYDNQQYYMRPNGLGPQRDTFFQVYNILTGEGKRTTSCGRCLANMRLQLQQLKKHYDTMNQYPVYRTPKGTLTLKVQKDTPSIFLIRTTTLDLAKECLEVLRTQDVQTPIEQTKL